MTEMIASKAQRRYLRQLTISIKNHKNKQIAMEKTEIYSSASIGKAHALLKKQFPNRIYTSILISKLEKIIKELDDL